MQDLPWLQSSKDSVLAEVKADRLAHALLVQGEEGVGLVQLARWITQYRLCHQPVDAGCGQCKSCQLLSAGTHPDLKLIEPTGAGEVIKVDQIREAVTFLAQTPQVGDWKLVCVSDAHRMNLNAANALLKILEEPPGNSLLILVTDRPQLLIPTVRSRCRKLALNTPTVQETKSYCLSEDLTDEQFETLFPLLGPRPLKIVEWAREGVLARWQALVDGLNLYVSGKSTTGDLTDRLKELSLAEILEWLMVLTAGEMRNNLGNTGQSIKLGSLYEWLARSRQDEERGTNPNRQLMLDEAFLRWKSAVGAATSTHTGIRLHPETAGR